MSKLKPEIATIFENDIKSENKHRSQKIPVEYTI